MAITHGKDTKVYVGGYDLTTYFRQASLPGTAAVAETATFSSGSKSVISGLKDAMIKVQGLFDGAANAVDAVLKAAFGINPSIWTYLPQGDVLGYPGYGLQGIETVYEVDGSIGDVVQVRAEARADKGHDPLVIHRVLGADTTTTTGTAQNNGAATTNGGVGYLQVTAFTGFTSAVVTIEDSADGSTGWATILTFSTVTAARTAERIAISGAVRQYTRYKMVPTGSGSITLAVGFGRK